MKQFPFDHDEAPGNLPTQSEVEIAAFDPMLVLSIRDVEALLPMTTCIELMEDALAALARDEGVQPLRLVIETADKGGAVALMPAQMGTALGFKAVTVFPSNAGSPYPTHQALIALIDRRNGRMFALVDGTSVTAIRTAAVSAVATRQLSRRESSTLCILGSGAQASAHVEAISAVRPIERVQVWSRSLTNAQRFARAHGTPERPVEAAPHPSVALEGADVVVTATSAGEPVLRHEWLAPGTHINAVGSCVPTAREIDSATIAASRVFVDRRESALAEAGDLLIAIDEGAVTSDHIEAELGDVLVGRHPGRRSPQEITMFESLGLGIEDVLAASYVVERARAEGRGSTIP